MKKIVKTFSSMSLIFSITLFPPLKDLGMFHLEVTFSVLTTPHKMVLMMS
jgi:hypothetical protein